MTTHTPGAMRAAHRIQQINAGAVEDALNRKLPAAIPQSILDRIAAIISEETGDADLLAALEAQIKAFERWSACGGSNGRLEFRKSALAAWKEATQQSRAAIAKAHGEG